MSANRGAWVGDRAFRCHETECPVFLFANNATVVAQEVLEEAVFFANHQSPIAAANAETRLRRVMLAPYGDWPNSRGLQRFQKPDAEEIVKEFSNVVNKLLNPASWLGLPWYEGHPDHPDFRGKPGHTRATAVGRIKSLEAGDDGLYANVKFNEDGERLISNESYHGHSVNWFLTRDKQAANAFRPFRLKSVGFTNEPNIPVPAVTLANAGTSEGARIGWQHRTGAAYKASSVATSFDAQLHRGEFGDITPARLRQSAEMHEEAARAHNSANYNVENAHDISESQARIVGSAHSDHSSYHKRIARRHLDEADRMSAAAKTGANSSPISRFRAMAQMREMANAWSDAARAVALEARKKSALAKEEPLKRSMDGKPRADLEAYEHTKKAHAASLKTAKETGKGGYDQDAHNFAASLHSHAAESHRKAGDIHMASLHESAAQAHKSASVKIHEETWANKLSANSQSRFAVMRGMREMANAGTSEGAKKGWAKRIGGLTAGQHLDKFAHWSDAASLRHASSHREAYNAIAVAHNASALAIKTDHPKDHYKASVAHETAAQVAKDLGEPTLQRKHEAYSEDHHKRGMELDPDGKTFKQSS